jgi:hypothetical protein
VDGPQLDTRHAYQANDEDSRREWHIRERAAPDERHGRDEREAQEPIGCRKGNEDERHGKADAQGHERQRVAEGQNGRYAPHAQDDRGESGFRPRVPEVWP